MRGAHRTGRLLGLAVVVCGLAASSAPAAVGDDINGPRCLNVVEGDAAYITDAGTPTAVGFVAVESATPCRDLSWYVLHVLDETGTVELAQVGGTAGSAANEVSFSLPMGAGAPSTVCVYYTTGPARRVVDRAPDDGCALLTLDGSPPARAFH